MAARILVVEDNATNQELMVYLLQAFGYAALTAANGLEALERLHADPVDLVVCDLEMPLMDGYSLARHIRGAKRYLGLPLVAVSAYAMVGDREKVLAAGFDGYISKPIDPETFVNSVQAFLSLELRAPAQPAVEQAAAPSTPLPPATARILVLDDSPTNLSLMCSTLQPSGYEVITAVCLEEAQAKILESLPDLVVSDFHLAPDNGLDFLRWVKKQPGLGAVPFVIITSSSNDSFDHTAATQSGASNFITRPIEPEALLAEVRKHLNGRRDGPSI